MISRLLTGAILGLWVVTMAGWVLEPPLARGAETVKVHVFPGSANLALMVAEEKGFFAKNNIKLQLSFTRSSKEQMTGIRDGKWDLGSTSPDNVIAYNVNEGTDFFLFMGVGGTTIRLVVDPTIKSFNDLKGKPLGVDALTTGFAFVLQKILHENGIKPGEYKLISVGGTGERFESMKKKETVGALLTPPFIGQALQAGFKDMGEVTRYIPDYLSTAGFTTRRWANAHGDTLVRFIKGNIEGVDWVFDPGNRREAASILARELKIPPALAAKSIEEDLMHPKMGMIRKAALPVEGLKTVIALRAEMGHLKPPLPDPAQFYDLSYYGKATR